MHEFFALKNLILHSSKKARIYLFAAQLNKNFLFFYNIKTILLNIYIKIFSLKKFFF